MPAPLPLLPTAARLLDGFLPPIVASAVEDAGGFEPADPTLHCPRCGQPLGSGCRGPEDRRCDAAGAPWSRLHQLGPYEEELASWIGSMKFRREWAWAEALGRWLAGVRRVPGPACPVPLRVAFVPMPPLRRWRRGFNQARLMAESFADETTRLGEPAALAPLLRRRRAAGPQRGLGRQERLRHMRRAFAPARPLTPGPVVLVDDVLTTGATLRAACRTLRTAGHGPIEVAVAAVVPKRR